MNRTTGHTLKRTVRRTGGPALGRTLVALGVLAAVAALDPEPASAEDRWGFDLRAAAGVATQDDARDTSENGFGFGATFYLRLQEHLYAYGGWDWMRYQALGEIAGPDVDLEETGYHLGLRFEHPFGDSDIRWWVRGGALIHHFEFENADGDIFEDTGHGLGWEGGAGVTVPLGRAWSLTPGVRYRSVNREAELLNVTTDVELQAVTFELGIRRRF